MSRHKLIEQSWTNSIGQTISPGDRVLAIASGYAHSTHVRDGKFLGTVNGNPTVLVDDRLFGYWTNGVNVGYKRGQELRIKGTWEPCKRRTTLRAKRVYKLA